MRHQTSILFNFPSFLTLILFIIFCSAATTKALSILQRGKTLSVENDKDVLTSLDNTFTCGFYGTGGNAYWFSIWFTNSKDRTVVWTANRDRPVNGKGSKVSLRRDGNMVLTDVDGNNVWETMTTNNVSRAELLDTGNLVLTTFQGTVVWQSFNFPTDTLLPSQLFTKSTTLVSKLGRGNFASGYFRFFYDDNNVLTLTYDGPEISSIYWPTLGLDIFQNGRTNYNSSRIASFDDMGNFLSSDQLQFSASDMGFGIHRRLTMDTDGNLRLYSLNNATELWVVSWQALLKQCDVHGVCGRNGICVNTPVPKCSCPPGYEATEPGNWNEGCKPKFNKTCSQSLEQVKFVQVMQVDYYGYDLNFSMSITQEDCMKLCLYDCRCEAYSYRLTGEGRCYTKSALFNGLMSPNFPGSIYLKMPVTLETSEPIILNGTDPVCGSTEADVPIGSPSMYNTIGKKVKWVYLYSFAGAIGVIELLFIALGWLLFGRHGVPASVEDGYRAISSQFRSFSYSELKKATKNFKEELGRGASGAVYKGSLADERVVAVKRLADSYQEGDEFWAEVSTIGKIYHMNLVRMWGFCSEKRHRLLVYEFMENQSLDKRLFSSNFLGWKERFKVALGTAKGLAYLHHECLEWVIHCDVKPENILLDNEFEPKIADFGLAKLSKRGSNSSEFSRIRGTKGYMAPEWALNHPITAKVDVYSYGVVVLELVKGIRLSNWITRDGEEQESELTRFVRLAKMRIQSEEDASWIDEIVDQRLNGKFNRKQAAAIVKVGISCVKEDRNQRPSMDSVVQSLLDIQEEPKIHTPDN